MVILYRYERMRNFAKTDLPPIQHFVAVDQINTPIIFTENEQMHLVTHLAKRRNELLK